MPCYHPLHGFRSQVRSASGKRAIVFRRTEGFSDLPVSVPCASCIGCRLEYRRGWAVRCLHEASLHEDNAFVTLTYDDDHLPWDWSLEKRALQLFLKRLRKAYEPRRFRYFACGEYGDRHGRPHFHALLFGISFDDRVPWSNRGGYPVARSPMLEAAWTLGHSEVGVVTAKSAAYVAGYAMKKLRGKDAAERFCGVDVETGETYKLEREFVTMSRRPGIGRRWIEQFRSDVFPRDEVIVDGRAVKPPRYYLEQLDKEFPSEALRVRGVRETSRDPNEESWRRLRSRERVAESRASLASGRRTVG